MMNLEKLGLSSEDVLQRSQLARIQGGGTWVCYCGFEGGGHDQDQFLVMADDTIGAVDVATVQCQVSGNGGIGATCE
ncbi:hypothetical protein MM239_14710 [Belliella sp. DSM 111904]|uniref:Natural product n=1 Tax=Belliella filtrata TaxID=2923435 RepID=A0ABS9V2L7_9BACT|nr:hypothetical protein [Belliella filtrata]MCH7410657.1 hypothetical protein [Belliella filtrata]